MAEVCMYNGDAIFLEGSLQERGRSQSFQQLIDIAGSLESIEQN